MSAKGSLYDLGYRDAWRHIAFVALFVGLAAAVAIR